MRRRLFLLSLLLLLILAGLYGFRVAPRVTTDRSGKAGPVQRAVWLLSGVRTSKLRIRVVNSSTLQGIPGAGCVLPATGQRVETDQNGTAPLIDAPVLRNPRLDELLAEVSGELTLICYKSGYRDHITLGVRLHEKTETQVAVRMTRVGPQDKRIEPEINTIPPHRTWQIQLADRYRLFEEGEGPERPELTRPGRRIAPQEMLGGYVQTPIQRGPGAPAERVELGPTSPGQPPGGAAPRQEPRR
jgi:hypothetical protein